MANLLMKFNDVFHLAKNSNKSLFVEESDWSGQCSTPIGIGIEGGLKRQMARYRSRFRTMKIEYP
ncbi:hypothetical protein CN601_12740 [Bacillus sp. AFS017336]|nr:hypothetical protein CN601_12740 [Bacillus sp. AFS017336]